MVRNLVVASQQVHIGMKAVVMRKDSNHVLPRSYQPGCFHTLQRFPLVHDRSEQRGENVTKICAIVVQIASNCGLYSFGHILWSFCTSERFPSIIL